MKKLVLFSIALSMSISFFSCREKEEFLPEPEHECIDKTDTVTDTIRYEKIETINVYDKFTCISYGSAMVDFSDTILNIYGKKTIYDEPDTFDIRVIKDGNYHEFYNIKKDSMIFCAHMSYNEVTNTYYMSEYKMPIIEKTDSTISSDFTMYFGSDGYNCIISGKDSVNIIEYLPIPENN